jgi:hypothetical protein
MKREREESNGKAREKQRRSRRNVRRLRLSVPYPGIAGIVLIDGFMELRWISTWGLHFTYYTESEI